MLKPPASNVFFPMAGWVDALGQPGSSSVSMIPTSRRSHFGSKSWMTMASSLRWLGGTPIWKGNPGNLKSWMAYLSKHNPMNHGWHINRSERDLCRSGRNILLRGHIHQSWIHLGYVGVVNYIRIYGGFITHGCAFIHLWSPMFFHLSSATPHMFLSFRLAPALRLRGRVICPRMSLPCSWSSQGCLEPHETTFIQWMVGCLAVYNCA
jgi:hypothetical protein